MLKFIPVCATYILLFFSYFYYFSIWSINPLSVSSLFVLCIFHIFYLLTVLSLLQINFASPGTVPSTFVISSIPLYLKQNSPENVVARYYLLGRVGFCTKCCKDKPHRAHHCHVCNQCVLRYDHHCWFINNCIGLRTHKSFVLFLIYSGFCGLIATFHIFFVDFHEFDWKLALFLVFLSVTGLFLTVFGLNHLYSIWKNFTSIESKWETKDLFDQGPLKNIEQVFGETFFLWFLPFDTSSIDGLRFPMKLKLKGTHESVPFAKYLL